MLLGPVQSVRNHRKVRRTDSRRQACTIVRFAGDRSVSSVAARTRPATSSTPLRSSTSNNSLPRRASHRRVSVPTDERVASGRMLMFALSSNRSATRGEHLCQSQASAHRRTVRNIRIRRMSIYGFRIVSHELCSLRRCVFWKTRCARVGFLMRVRSRMTFAWRREEAVFPRFSQ